MDADQLISYINKLQEKYDKHELKITEVRLWEYAKQQLKQLQ